MLRIFCGNYGEAGAINWLGRKKGLPNALSGHNSYYLWGPGNYTGEVVIVLGASYNDLLQNFDEVVEAGRTACKLCMPYENNLPIFICRGIKRSMSEFWPELKHFN